MASSIAFNGFDLTADPSPRGGRFSLLDLEGWGKVSNRRDRSSRMQQAGSEDSPGYAESPTVTAAGLAEYLDPQQCALERRELLALAGGGRYPFTVVDAAGEWTRIVEVEGLEVAPLTDAQYEWTLVVTAPDPVVYGPATFSSTGLSSAASGTGLTYPLTYPLDYGTPAGETPGQVQVANAGTVSYLPRLRIDGPVTNPTVVLAETGDRIAYSGAVADGQWLDIDCARRRVLLNGLVSQRQRVSFVGAWLAIPVGGGTLSWTADDADPAASLSVWGFEGAFS